MGVHPCQRVRMVLREQLESHFSPSTLSIWGMDSVTSLASKCLYLLSHRKTFFWKLTFVQVIYCLKIKWYLFKKSEKVRSHTACLNQILKGWKDVRTAVVLLIQKILDWWLFCCINPVINTPILRPDVTILLGDGSQSDLPQTSLKLGFK